MKPEQDSWNKLVIAWRNESQAGVGCARAEETAPLGFSTRIIAQWQSVERASSSVPRWLDIWSKCAVPAAFVAVLAAIIFATFEKVSEPRLYHHSDGLFPVPDLAPPNPLD